VEIRLFVTWFLIFLLVISTETWISYQQWILTLISRRNSLLGQCISCIISWISIFS